MQVLKFGGTSVATAGNIQKVIEIVRLAGFSDQTIVVVQILQLPSLPLPREQKCMKYGQTSVA